MKLLISAKMFFDSGRKTKRKFSVKDGWRLFAFSLHYGHSAFICSILIHAIFPFPKKLSERKIYAADTAAAYVCCFLTLNSYFLLGLSSRVVSRPLILDPSLHAFLKEI